MKKLLRLKAMLLLCALMAGGLSAWGDNKEASFDMTSSTSSPKVVNGVTFAWTSSNIVTGSPTSSGFKASSNMTVTIPTGAKLINISKTNGNTWGGGATINVYAGSDATGTNIASIVSGTNSYDISSNNTGTTYYLANTTSKNAWLKTLVITYEEAKVPTSISISGYKTKLYVDDEFSFGGTVTAHYSESADEDVTALSTFSGYTMSEAGNYTVTVSYGGQSQTYTLTVEERPKFTVTYSDGGSVTEESVGAGVTLASRSNVGEYTFLGWAESEVATETKVAPEYATGTYYPADNITLYPVYKRTIAFLSDDIEKSVSIADYASANSWTNSTKYGTVNIAEGISANMELNGNTGQYNSSSNTWRMYQTNSSELTINAETGYELVSATITYAISNGGVLVYNSRNISSGTAVSLSGTASSEFSVGQTGTATNGQVQISTISVTYKTTSTTYYVSTPITTIDIALNAACTDGTKYYGTFSSSHGFVVPSGLTVSEIKVVDGKLSLTDYDEDDVVPAYTGVMIASTTAGSKTVTLASGGTSKLGSDNMLKASGDADISAANMTVAGTKFYRLTMHNGTDIGFWWGAADGAAFDIAANKAYLAVPTADAARIQTFWFEDEVNGIDNPQLSTLNSQPTYTLSGQRVEKAKKGLYIVNGKKCVIR